MSYRPASVTFPVPASPIFFAAPQRSKSALSRRHRDGLSTPLLSNEEEQNRDLIEDDIEAESGESQKLIRNKKDLLILIALCLSYFNAFCAFSMIAPIFPYEVIIFFPVVV